MCHFKERQVRCVCNRLFDWSKGVRISVWLGPFCSADCAFGYIVAETQAALQGKKVFSIIEGRIS